MSELISNEKVKARHFHATKRSIDDLGTLNNGGAFNDVYKDIYPPELQLKVEHSGTHATFLNLDIPVKDGMFIYKLFDKRDAFPLFIIYMPYKFGRNCDEILSELLSHLHLDIPSHLLIYSNKGQNPSAGIELKICFLLY